MSQKLFCFRFSLLSYLKDSHPNLAADAAFIAARGDAAAEVTAQPLKTGKPMIRQANQQMKFYMQACCFPLTGSLSRSLWNVFEKEVTSILAEGVAMVLLPKLNEMFSKYDLTDSFETAPEHDQLYTELTGAIQILLEDGIQ